MSNILLYSVLMLAGLIVIIGFRGFSKNPTTQWYRNLEHIHVSHFIKGINLNAHELFWLISGCVFFIFGLIGFLNSLGVI